MEQILDRRPGVFALAARAWRSALAAFLGMLPLFAMVAAAFLALNYAFPILEQKLAVIRPASSSVFVLMVVPHAWVFGLEKLALGLAAAPAALATMRHVLIDDGWRLSPGPLLRFWFWVAAVLVLSLGALFLSGFAATPELQLASLVLQGIAIVIPVLFLMIFPAVAADEPATGFAARMDKALERWDGNLWRTVIVLALTAGPALLLQRLPTAIILRRPGANADMAQKFHATLIGSAVDSALMVLFIAIVSAGVAWAFASARLPRPVKQPLGTETTDTPQP
jgi:hypothetical protein